MTSRPARSTATVGTTTITRAVAVAAAALPARTQRRPAAVDTVMDGRAVLPSRVASGVPLRACHRCELERAALGERHRGDHGTRCGRTRRLRAGARIVKTPASAAGNVGDMTTNPMSTGRVQAVLIDCAHPAALAGFYRRLLGGEIAESGDDYALLAADGIAVAFQHVADEPVAGWPGGGRRLHLDVAVADVAAARRRLAEHGAVEPEFQPGGEDWIVLLDPEGHPFCIMASD
jgi:hypothetical protein